MNRVTQHDIADAVGCSQVTVSRALNDDRRVQPALRERVQAAARRLGYRPDPMLKALVSFRRRGSARSLNSSLAFIYAGSKPSPNTLFSNYEFYLGSSRKARQSGFSLELHRLDPAETDGRRLARVLHHRGVKGIIFALSSAHLIFTEPIIELPNFAAIVLGYNFSKHPVNCIMPDHYNSIRVAISQARERGFRRLGLVVSETLNERVEFAFTDGFRRAVRELEPGSEPRVHLFSHRSPAEIAGIPARLREWLRDAKPDLIIGDLGGRKHLLSLPNTGPAKGAAAIPFICLDLRARSHVDVSGLVADRALMGEIAVDNLFAQIMNNRLGLPSLYQRILVQSEWREGTTCPARANA